MIESAYFSKKPVNKKNLFGSTPPFRLYKVLPAGSIQVGRFGYRLFILLLFLQVSSAAWSQEKQLRYSINRQGQKVGELTFRQTTEDNKTTYAIESLVKVSMVLSFTVQAWESSVYENNVLQSSALVRHVNGKQKINKKIKNNGTGLTVINEGTEKELKNFRVKYSTHCLYTTEPVTFTNVFSDNYQKFIPIVKLANNHYRLTFPDGNSNEYFYENGVCKKVKVKSNLFDAEFVLSTL